MQESRVLASLKRSESLPKKFPSRRPGHNYYGFEIFLNPRTLYMSHSFKLSSDPIKVNMEE